MKKHELNAAIAAAEAKLARLRAVTPEPELHPMTLPLERLDVHWRIPATGGCQQYKDARDGHDTKAWCAANYYASRPQAEGYADAFETMRLMRRQPGIVDPSRVQHCYVRADAGAVSVQVTAANNYALHIHIFPAYESKKAAAAAVAAVGEERLVRCSNWLAGVLLPSNNRRDAAGGHAEGYRKFHDQGSGLG